MVRFHNPHKGFSVMAARKNRISIKLSVSIFWSWVEEKRYLSNSRYRFKSCVWCNWKHGSLNAFRLNYPGFLEGSNYQGYLRNDIP